MIMEPRESFDNAAQLYDEARPSYPDEVIDGIIGKTGVSTDKTLIEIGPGTGQATVKFAERGYSIRCVEMGRKLAGLLKQKTKFYNVTVDVSSFEAWEPEHPFTTPFIYSATAFHWIDPKVKYKKCHDLLEDGGYLVLFWNVASRIEIPAVQKAFELVREYYPERSKAHRGKKAVASERKSEIVGSGLFTLKDYFEHSWSFSQTVESFTKGFYSHSSYLALDEMKRERLSVKVEKLFEELGDAIESEITTTVYVARKK